MSAKDRLPNGLTAEQAAAFEALAVAIAAHCAEEQDRDT